MTSTTTSSSPKASLVAATLLPGALVTAWLVISRNLLATYGLLDWAALGVGLAVGAPFAWRVPHSVPMRVGGLALYILIGTLGLIAYMLLFVGLVYGRWL